ncbi:MAG: NADH-quinone oxidoreductase subunit J [Thermoplasmatota archaeon]
MTPPEWVAFGILAAVIFAGALWSVLTSRTFHAALGLGVALMGIGGLFISMGNPFIGLIQIMVYVGGILTLLVFAVMFVAGDEEEVEA